MTPPPLGVSTSAGRETLRIYPEVRLDELVARQAERTPDAPALCLGSTVVTYAQLMIRARRVARVLGARGVERQDRVAVCLDRSIDQIVGIVGILVAGAAYVPIDPHGPAERRRFLFEDAAPRAIVTLRDFVDAMPSGLDVPVVILDDSNIERADDSTFASTGTTDDLAYVIYTSGSTGIPKGVLNAHRGISNHVAWMGEAFPLTAADRVLAKASPVFDVSVWEWFWPLSQGAGLVLLRPGAEKDPRAVLSAVESHAITNIHFVPTLLRLLLEHFDFGGCHSVKRVFCSGEALTPEIRDRVFERMPGPPALINLYGPTEAAVHVTGWVCTPGETGPVPIGRTLPNVRAYIVDEALKPVPPGVKGELLIGGVQVAMGYHRRPTLTLERFIPDPFVADPAARCYRTGDCVSWRDDGVIDFFGRYDSQVQIGGVRVELGEIEAALRRHPEVGDAAVIARDSGSATRLVAYLRRVHGDRGPCDPSVDSLRRRLTETLPDYMMPVSYVWLDAFPVTPTGKLDRSALPDPSADRPTIEQRFEPPHEGTEARLARLWSNHLQIDRIGRHDDFHALGGDSISALQVVAAIAIEFGVELPPGELLRSPTLARLAARVESNGSSRASSSIVTLRAGDTGEALFLPPSMGGDLGYWRELVGVLAPGRPVFGFTVPEELDGTSVDIQRLAAAMVRDLVAFQPEGPYHLAGYSFSAALALEMALQLRASGRRVGLLAMIDYGPGAPPSWSSRLRTAGYFFANLPHWLRDDILQAGWTALAARTRRKLATLGRKIASIGRRESQQLAEWAVGEMFEADRLPQSHRGQMVDYLGAFFRYEPQPYDGRVTLFRARSRPLFHSLTPSLGWEHYARGGFDCVPVACTHDTILKPPHVQVIAAGFENGLRTHDARSARVEAAAPLMMSGHGRRTARSH